MTIQNVAVQSDRQPRGLYLLFFTELWERFGFYTLQTILMLYMTKALLMPEHKANTLYATFNSLLYLTPTIGGYIADRFLGSQRAVMFGGVLFIIAYYITALPDQTSFFFGLSLLICANGLFKPNVSSLVGELYHKNDPRRDGGFTLFYMGINIGSLIPPLITTIIITTYGWHAVFLLAAIGMTIGQVIFLIGKKCLGTAGMAPHIRHTSEPSYRVYAFIIAGMVACVALCNVAFKYPDITNYLIEITTVIIFCVTFFFLLKEPLVQRKRMIASLILIVISIGFWSLYNQTFTSLMLFADRNMSKKMLGMTISAETTQFFNPFFILLLGLIFSHLWTKLDRYGLNPSVQLKFALGVSFMSAGFLLLAFGTSFYSHDGMASPWWLVFSYLLQTTGELLLSPIGLTMITVLSPKHLVGMMMGVWFSSTAVSFTIGGILANIAAIPANTPLVSSLAIYSHAFTLYALIAFVIALISFALLPLLKRMINAEAEAIDSILT
jgi:POT family proton-dependent oligopeptide transporter